MTTEENYWSFSFYLFALWPFFLPCVSKLGKKCLILFLLKQFNFDKNKNGYNQFQECKTQEWHKKNFEKMKKVKKQILHRCLCGRYVLMWTTYLSATRAHLNDATQAIKSKLRAEILFLVKAVTKMVTECLRTMKVGILNIVKVLTVSRSQLNSI